MAAIFSEYTDIQMAMSMEEMEYRRLSNYVRYWKAYLGDEWLPRRDDGQENLRINYNKALVDKGIAFFALDGFNVLVPKENVQVISLLNFLWEQNRKNVFLFDLALMGSVTGDGFVKVFPEDIFDSSGKLVHRKISIELQDSDAVRPEWEGVKYEIMKKCTIKYASEGLYSSMKDSPKKEKKEEIWYPDHIERTTDGEMDKGYPKPNLLGVIPIVHIKNVRVPKYPYGYSDMADTVALNSKYNAVINDISEIIDYHAAPVTMIFGAKASKLERGARKTWGGLPKDARVENLKLEGDLMASNTFLEHLKLALHEISGVPEATLGKQQPVSNTSGVALHIQYMPLIEKTKRKKLAYAEGIAQVCKLMIAVGLAYEFIDRKAFDKVVNPWDIRVRFPDPLPKDKLIQMQLIQQKSDAALTTRVDSLKELGEENPVQKIQEITQDRIYKAKEDGIVMALQEGMMQPPAEQLGGAAQGMLDKSETVKGAAEQEKGKV